MKAVRSVVLIDAPEGSADFDQEMLERMGHEVIVCHGPKHKELCPILRQGGQCALVDDAHGIVFELDLDRPMHRAILRRYQEVVKEGIPIRVLLRPGQAEQYAELLESIETWTQDPDVADLDAFSARVEGYERVSLQE